MTASGTVETTSRSPAAPASASDDNSCAQAEFSAQQFTGDWSEPGNSTITTLAPDGTLKSHGGDGDESGTWSYVPWLSTPGRDQIPAGEANRCVLWLHWANPAPALDQVYVPLKVTAS